MRAATPWEVEKARFGLRIFLFCDGLFFFGLCYIHIHLRTHAAGGIEPDLTGLWSAVLGLFTAAGLREISERRRAPRLRAAVPALVLLVGVVLGWTLHRWSVEGLRPSDSRMAFSLFVLTGALLLHAAAGFGVALVASVRKSGSGLDAIYLRYLAYVGIAVAALLQTLQGLA